MKRYESTKEIKIKLHWRYFETDTILLKSSEKKYLKKKKEKTLQIKEKNETRDNKKKHY